MRITQVDFRTVQIEKHPTRCRLRYNLYQEGEIRYPESITCRADTVVAYFLTSTIRDFITETAHGFHVDRHWNIIPEGSFGLSFRLEFPADAKISYLFPGLSTGDSVPPEGHRVSGRTTSYANGLYLFGKPESTLIFTDTPRSPTEAGSIEVKPEQGPEDQPLVGVEVRIPSASPELPPKKSRKKNARAQFFQSDGEFGYDLCLHVVTAAADHIHRRAVSAVLERHSSGLHPAPRPAAADSSKFIAGQLRACLDEFLYDQGPVCGLLETARESRISAVAGCTLALIQLRNNPGDKEGVELARRLVDFALKGQHPAGMFYPSYQNDRRSWLSNESPLTVPLDEAVAVALMMLRFAVALRSNGLAASAYLHAVSHLAEALLAAKSELEQLSGRLHPDSLLPSAPGMCSAVLIQLFHELHQATGKDMYRKAVRSLQSGSTLQGYEATDFQTALHRAQSAVMLNVTGKELQRYFEDLLPWIHLNNPGSASEPNPVGGVRPTLGASRLIMRGFELTYTLLKLDARIPKKARLPQLDVLIRQLLGFTSQKPMGTAFSDLEGNANERFGPRNSRIWMSELYYTLRIAEEFPGILPHQDDSPVPT